ncbi:MAG: ABC transporter permease [Planctomycetes bacterium]|nr:ABC transporter permease [Planctomycetota bacterium]
MLKLFLWLKYVRKRRIILLSVVAVALSVALLIAVASLFTGFIAAFERSAAETVGDILLRAPEGIRFEKYPALLERLEESDLVEAATASLSAEGLVHLGGGNVRPVVIWGIEPGRRSRAMEFKETLISQRHAAQEPSFAVPGAPGETGGFVGIGVLAKPDEQTDQYDQDAIRRERINQQARLITGTMELKPTGERGPRRRTITFRIVDIVFAGVYLFDSSFVYIPIEVLQRELYPQEKDPVATHINVKLKPGVAAEAAVEPLRGIWQAFATRELNWSSMAIDLTAIRTAREMQRIYVGEFEKQKRILEITFSAVSVSVVVLVFCIFHMMVRLKQKDMAILKSCGAASSSVVGLFLGFGVSVGVAGSGLGTALGYLITRHINQVEEGIRLLFGLKLWRSSVYMFDRIPNEVDWSSALLYAALALTAAAVGALLPAVAAARTRPVEVLRHE